ncbi:MAG: methyltransferase domain-containing protein [Acidimicrobiia bacterium]|nr:methyltransferase domain-containing protein [Acidimicrobiia bacterium]
MTSSEWPGYVRRFHDARPGITEEVLCSARDVHGVDPYRWVARAVPDGTLLDVACGSGPLAAVRPAWTGLDCSMAELRQAHRRGPLVAGRADAMPLADGSVAHAALVMALMVVDSPLDVLAEVVRVLSPGGAVAVLVPADGPLTARDAFAYGLLLSLVGRTALPFPRPEVVAQPRDVLESGGFEIVADERRRFELRLDPRGGIGPDRFVESLYLPDIGHRRRTALRGLARRWGSTHIGLPLRLLVGRVRTGTGRGRR